MAPTSADSKQPMSGIKTLSRDWSMSQPNSQSSDASISAYWPPTPSDNTSASDAESKPLTGLQKRLKDIEDALAGRAVEGEVKKEVLMHSSSTIFNKRPLDTQVTLPPAKKRQLPWSQADPESSKLPKVTTSSQNRTTSFVTVPATTKLPKRIAVLLSQEQTQILKLVQEGNNVFYTGSAGTGKSVLLREIITTLRKKFVKSLDALAITASTGIAACNIGGVTIHSFAGIGLGIESAEELAQKIRKNKKASARWLRTKVLIIDEVSMVDGDLFDKLAKIGSILRKSAEPFGGIQVIVTGDFFQLPPVTKGMNQVKFAFEAQLWNETIKRTFNLSKVFRQSDQDFVDMLNEMRFGRLSSKSIKKFMSLSRDIVYEDGIHATELFPRREDVDRANSGRMALLSTESKPYRALDGGSITDQNQREKMLANFMAPAELTLRVDAQVMLIKNMDETLVNGSMGRIVRFVDPAKDEFFDQQIGKTKDAKKPSSRAGADTGKLYPLVRFITSSGAAREIIVTPEVWKVELPNGEVQVSRSQLPLILAWAMSIHKSQGQTLERVKVDLGKVFEKGQAYVALSRATSLDGLQVLNFNPDKVKAHPKVVEWSKTLETIQID